MNSRTTRRFRELLAILPAHVRLQARAKLTGYFGKTPHTQGGASRRCIRIHSSFRLASALAIVPLAQCKETR